MKIKNRNIVTSVILSLVTCGIYGIYWTYCIVKESVSVNDPADNGVLEILLSIFLPFIGFYFTEKKFSEGCASQGIEHTGKSVIYLVLCLLLPGTGAIITLVMMQNEINRILSIIE